MKKLVIVCLTLAALLVLVVILGRWGLRYGVQSQRRQAERAVTTTVDSIRQLVAHSAVSLDAVTNAAVAPAAVQVLSTNPVLFRVHATTPWPDWMIYEYDSRTPERGVYHYLF